jgi:hypothetical protein
MSDTDIQETWEIQIPGTARVWVRDRRFGTYQPKKVSGKGPKRITLSRDEREYNQELVPEENERHNPWTNGTLVQIVGGTKQGELTDEALRAYLELESEEAFTEAVSDIDIELTLRRLIGFAATDGRMWQVTILRELIDERYRVGGTQRTVQEMYDEGELDRSTRLS